MQDVRLRTGSAALLSLIAFTGIPGATMAFIWWLLFSRPREVLTKARVAVPAAILIAFFSIVLEITGGGGISYGIRMVVILLIGVWVYSRYCPGDFLGLLTWLLGKKTGFDLGMVGEMGMQALDLMMADFSRIRYAYDLKGSHQGIRSIVPAGTILICGALRHAEETAELMAVRGYDKGGTYCPEFRTTGKDILAGLAALCMGIMTFLPVSEFFILYH